MQAKNAERRLLCGVTGELTWAHMVEPLKIWVSNVRVTRMVCSESAFETFELKEHDAHLFDLQGNFLQCSGWSVQKSFFMVNAGANGKEMTFSV